MKEGRSGRFALVKVEHRIFVEGENGPAVIEHQDYVLREAGVAAAARPAASGPAEPGTTAAPPDASQTLVPDELLLFRYSAVTDNPHRIHYDRPYATGTEGYPSLLVNGSIPAMFLLELFRAAAGREPESFSSRNVAPMLCGRALHLNARDEGGSWRLWAHGDDGVTAFDARAE